MVFRVPLQFVVTPETVELAAASWKYAMSGESPPFLEAKMKEPSLTPLVFFYNQFYVSNSENSDISLNIPVGSAHAV